MMVDEPSGILWAEVENRLRVLLAEFRAELLADIYTRNLDPLKQRVDEHDKFCQHHSDILTEQRTLLGEIVDAKLIRRVEVAESRISLIGKATIIIGSAAATSLLGILLGLLTHSIKF